MLVRLDVCRRRGACQLGWGWGLYDQVVEPPTCERGPDPDEDRLHTLSRHGQKRDVNEGPNHRCEEASGPHPHTLQDRVATSHRRQAPFVSVPEWSSAGALPEALLDDSTYVGSLLESDLGHTG